MNETNRDNIIDLMNRVTELEAENKRMHEALLEMRMIADEASVDAERLCEQTERQVRMILRLEKDAERWRETTRCWADGVVFGFANFKDKISNLMTEEERQSAIDAKLAIENGCEGGRAEGPEGLDAAIDAAKNPS